MAACQGIPGRLFCLRLHVAADIVGQNDAECRSLIPDAAAGYGSLHGIDKFFHDEQPKTLSGNVVALKGRFLFKGIIHFFLEFFTHPDAVVRHGIEMLNLSVPEFFGRDFEFDFSALRRIFDGIGKQVEDNLVEP